MKQHMVKFQYTNGAVLREGDTLIEISIDQEGLISLAHKVTTCLRWFIGPNKMNTETTVTLPIIGRITHIDHSLFEAGNYERTYKINFEKEETKGVSQKAI